MKRRPTLEEIERVFMVDCEKGSVRWRIAPPGKPDFKGKEAGCTITIGYRLINWRDETGFPFKIYAHRLIWFVVHGEWPNEIDHKNRKRDDNRISNLRRATRRQGNYNKAVQSTNWKEMGI